MEEQNNLDLENVMDQIEGSYEGSIDIFSELANKAFSEALKRVISTGKKGKLTLAFSLENIGDGRISITGDINSKLPEPSQKGKLFYHDLKGNLTTEDPRQPNLPNLKPLSRV